MSNEQLGELCGLLMECIQKDLVAGDSRSLLRLKGIVWIK